MNNIKNRASDLFETDETVEQCHPPEFIDPIYYRAQLVVNETTKVDEGIGLKSVFRPNRGSAIAGTISGAVIGTGIFVSFTFTDGIGKLQVERDEKTHQLLTGGVQSISFDEQTQEITILWERPPGSHYLMISYEYELL